MDVYHVQLRINALKLTLEELTEGIKQWERRDTLPTWMRHRHNMLNQAHPTRLRYIVGCEPLPEE